MRFSNTLKLFCCGVLLGISGVGFAGPCSHLRNWHMAMTSSKLKMIVATCTGNETIRCDMQPTIVRNCSPTEFKHCIFLTKGEGPRDILEVSSSYNHYAQNSQLFKAACATEFSKLPS